VSVQCLEQITAVTSGSGDLCEKVKQGTRSSLPKAGGKSYDKVDINKIK
jgi:hypothetical protein